MPTHSFHSDFHSFLLRIGSWTPSTPKTWNRTRPCWPRSVLTPMRSRLPTSASWGSTWALLVSRRRMGGWVSDGVCVCVCVFKRPCSSPYSRTDLALVRAPARRDEQSQNCGLPCDAQQQGSAYRCCVSTGPDVFGWWLVLPLLTDQ